MIKNTTILFVMSFMIYGCSSQRITSGNEGYGHKTSYYPLYGTVYLRMSDSNDETRLYQSFFDKLLVLTSGDTSLAVSCANLRDTLKLPSESTGYWPVPSIELNLPIDTASFEIKNSPMHVTIPNSCLLNHAQRLYLYKQGYIQIRVYEDCSVEFARRVYLNPNID